MNGLTSINDNEAKLLLEALVNDPVYAGHDTLYLSDRRFYIAHHDTPLHCAMQVELFSTECGPLMTEVIINTVPLITVDCQWTRIV